MSKPLKLDKIILKPTAQYYADDYAIAVYYGEERIETISWNTDIATIIQAVCSHLSKGEDDEEE